MWEGIEGIFTRGDYDLDSNSLESNFRTVAQSRKSSLFFGSHDGAERSVVFYSLAISCRDLGTNFFDYMNDVIKRAAELSPAKTGDKWNDACKEKWMALTPYNWMVEQNAKELSDVTDDSSTSFFVHGICNPGDAYLVLPRVVVVHAEEVEDEPAFLGRLGEYGLCPTVEDDRLVRRDLGEHLVSP